MANDSAEIKKILVTVCHRLEEKGFVVATEGNVSARLGTGNVLCTRRGLSKGMVTEEDIIEVSSQGDSRSDAYKPTTELKMHLYIYNERPDVMAVVHAHPVYATGFATARIPITECILPEIISGLGPIPLAEYATPSTAEVAASLSPYVRHADAVLLSNHGVVTFGKDPWDAYRKMEQVERAAQITFVAHLMGGGKPITGEEIRKLRDAYIEAYGKDFFVPNGGSIPDLNINSREMDEKFRELLNKLLQDTR